jgi:small-conductance mechanosensitive channel/CRP-like cAMP-binding protein
MKNYKVLVLTAIAGFLLFIFVLVTTNPQIIPALIFDGLKVAILVCLSAIVVDLLSFVFVNIWFKRSQGKQPSKLIKLVIGFFLYVICALVILKIFGQDTTTFTITSALFSFAIGFAIKDPLTNLFAGIFIQIDRPFDLGDTIEFKGLPGVVESIDWRTTDIRLSTGELNCIPNASIINDSVKLIHLDRVYRTVDFTATATISPHQVMNLVTQAVLDRPIANINLDRPVSVKMWSYSNSEITYKLFYYPQNHLHAIDSTEPEIRCRIWYALHRLSGENNLQVIEPERLLKIIDNFDLFQTLSIDTKRLLIEKSSRFLFDADEALTADNLLFPAMFFVIKGSIEIEQELVTNSDKIFVKPFSRKPKAHSNYELNGHIVDRVATNLAKYIGPVAFSLTYQAAKQVSSLYWLYTNLAPEIEDLVQQATFLRERPNAPTEYFQSGDFFGEMALFQSHPLPNVKMVAVEETELLVLTRTSLLEVLDRENISIETMLQDLTQYHQDFLRDSLQEVSIYP